MFVFFFWFYVISPVISSQLMKPGFFVDRATGETVKIFYLYSQGHLTFMENQIIDIIRRYVQDRSCQQKFAWT